MTLKGFAVAAVLAGLLVACINPIADAIVGNGDELDTVIVTHTVVDTLKQPPETTVVVDTVFCHTHDGHRSCK